MVSIYQQRQIAKRAQAQIWHCLKMKSLVQQTSDNSTKPLLGFQQAPMLFKELPNAYHFARKTTSFVAQTSDSSIKPSAGIVLGFQQSPRILRDLSKADQRWGSEPLAHSGGEAKAHVSVSHVVSNREETHEELSIMNKNLMDGGGFIISWLIKVSKFIVDYYHSLPLEQRPVIEFKRSALHVWVDVTGCEAKNVKVYLKNRICIIEASGAAYSVDSNLPRVRETKLTPFFKYDPNEATGYVNRGLLMIMIPICERKVDLKKLGKVEVVVVDT